MNRRIVLAQTNKMTLGRPMAPTIVAVAAVVARPAPIQTRTAPRATPAMDAVPRNQRTNQFRWQDFHRQPLLPRRTARRTGLQTTRRKAPVTGRVAAIPIRTPRAHPSKGTTTRATTMPTQAAAACLSRSRMRRRRTMRLRLVSGSQPATPLPMKQVIVLPMSRPHPPAAAV